MMFSNNPLLARQFGQRQQESKSRVEKECYALKLQEYITKNVTEIEGWSVNENYGCIELTNEKYPDTAILATPFFEGIEHIPYHYRTGGKTHDCNSTRMKPSYDLEEDKDKYLSFMEHYVTKIEYWANKGVNGFAKE